MHDTSIFKTAVKLPAHERAAYLDQACGVNAALRLEIEGLLRAHEQPGEFMFRPPIADMATDYRPGPERPGTRIGPYKLLQYLGEGGMGTVFLAEQSQPVRRMVALKIIKPGMDSSQILARFEAERQALAIMDHPNIAKVFDAGTTQTGLELPARPQNSNKVEGQNGNSPTHTYNGPSKGVTESIPVGRPYFVMELVKGVPITEFCDKNKLTTKQRLELFVPVCNAIQHAHMKGIIHRDIKPSNVLIALYDGKPVPKVIDFGVAKAMSEPLTERTMFTQIGQIVGTFEYMSPEQATLNQLDIDTRSDIYSLGVLLYELLTGMTPLSKDKLRTLALDQMLKTIREEEPVRPSVKLSSEAGALAVAAAYRNIPSSKLTGVLRGELDWIVMKCLEKERNRRFVTAGSLAEDIERYLRDEPVTACPPSLAYRAQKAYRKNKLAIFVTSVICAVLLVATAVSILFALNANRARHLAEAAEEEISKKHEIAEKAKSDAEAERDKNAVMVKKLSATEEERRRNQYAWDMQIMPTAMESGRVGQMQQLLNRHADDLRAFEWHYWNRQIHNEIRSLSLKVENSSPITSFEQSKIDRGFALSSPWFMNELGTRVACFSYSDEVMEKTEADSSRAIGTRTYFLDVYDTTDGKRVCHHQYYVRPPVNPGNVVISPRLSGIVLSRDGSRVAFAWSQPQVTAPRPGKTSDFVAVTLVRVIDVASGSSLYDVNLGSQLLLGPGNRGAQLATFFPDGNRLALIIAPPLRPASTGQEKNLMVESPNAYLRIIDLTTQPARQITQIENYNYGRGTVFTNFTISSDGTRLAHIKQHRQRDPNSETVTSSYSLRIVDAMTGKELQSIPLPGEQDSSRQNCFYSYSPDSSKLAVAKLSFPVVTNGKAASYYLTLSMYETQTGKELFKEVTDLGNQMTAGPLMQIVFSPDGRRLYFSSRNNNFMGGKAWAFHAESGKPLAGFDNDFGLDRFVFITNGMALINVEGNALVFRNPLTGKAVRTLRGHVQNITSVGLAADGRTVSTLDSSGEFKVWNTAPVRPLQLQGLPNAALGSGGASRLSPDGRYVVGMVVEEKEPVPEAGSSVAYPYSVEIKQLALWDTANGRRQPLPLRPMPEYLRDANDNWNSGNSIQYSSNSRYVCLARYRNTSERFSQDSSGLVKKNAPAKASVKEKGFCDVTVWDTASGQETAYFQSPPELKGFSPFFILGPEGNTLIASYQTRTNTPPNLTAFDLVSGRELWNYQPGSRERSGPMGSTITTLSPDGKMLLSFERQFQADRSNISSATMVETRLIRVINSATGKELRTLQLPNGQELINNTAWSPDSKRIALTSTSNFPNRVTGKLLRVFNVETGEQVMSLDAPAGGRMFLMQQVMFSPDGRRIVACQMGSIALEANGLSNIKVWDAATGTEMLTIPLERSPTTNLFLPQIAFTPDGYRIVNFQPFGGIRSSNQADHQFATVQFIDATPVKGQ